MSVASNVRSSGLINYDISNKTDVSETYARDSDRCLESKNKFENIFRN